MRNIKIFDTTLRDGEQTPGATMTIDEKIKIAKQLELLGVDIIEAGFAASSNGDFKAIQEISKILNDTTLCSLARAVEKDIELAGRAIEGAKNKRIHTFIATSDIHMEHKLKMSKSQVLDKAVNAVLFAKNFTDDIQFSFEDATRTDIQFMEEISNAIIEAGVTTINLPDTVGIRTPKEVGLLVSYLKNIVKDRAIISVHNHNDLGLATANSLEGIICGAGQVECTINGLGERAGNASLEEIVMAMKVKKKIFKSMNNNINLKEIYPTSRLISYVTGIEPQPNKAIVGKNAFSHESGIHQDGFLKNKETYQIIDPLDIGKTDNTSIVLGKLSGRTAFKAKIKELGFKIEEDKIDFYFDKFKELADYKNEIFDEDIIAIISRQDNSKLIELKDLDCVNKKITILIKGKEHTKMVDFSEKGIVNILFNVIGELADVEGRLLEYSIKSVTVGKDSLANATVKATVNNKTFLGHGLNIDTLDASCEAYISVINQYLEKK